MIIFSHSAQYIFHWKGAPPPLLDESGYCEFREIGFSSTGQAVMFLRQLGEPQGFKALLSERFPGQVSRWPLAGIHGKVAELLVKNQLFVVKRWPRATGAPVPGPDSPTKVERREPVEKAEASEPPTFLSNHDGPGQAATLAEAASGGEAFCEECQKAWENSVARASASPAETQEPSFQPDHDGDAQAESLVRASDAGAAFCEECKRAA
jgi:hypothetical protein